MKTFAMSCLLGLALCGSAVAEMDDSDMEAAIKTAQMVGESAAKFELCGIADTPRIRKALIAFARSCGGDSDQLTLIGDIADGARARVKRTLEAAGNSCPMSRKRAKADFDAMADEMNKLAAYNQCGM